MSHMEKVQGGLPSSIVIIYEVIGGPISRLLTPVNPICFRPFIAALCHSTPVTIGSRPTCPAWLLRMYQSNNAVLGTDVSANG